MNDHIKGTSGATIRFRRLHRLFALHGLPRAPAVALISRPRLPFIFSLVFSPFRTISSGTCPPEVNLPCTCRCLAPPPPPLLSPPTAAPPRREIVLLNSICFLISLSHSFSVTRPRGGQKGRLRADGLYLRPEKQEKPTTIYTFSEGWWVSGGYQAGSNGVSPSLVPQRPTHQLLTRSYGSNAGHIHHRDISSNYADNLTLLSNDESPAHQKAPLYVN